MDPPEADQEQWAGVLIFRALESGGHCRCRSWGDRLNHARFTRLGCESLEKAHEVLREADRPLFLRVLLLVGWEQNVRSTGLPLRVGKVLEVLGKVADPIDLAAAARDVIASEPGALKKIDLEGVLSRERGPGTGHVLELSNKEMREFGVGTQRIEFDRLEVAVSNFRPYGWEANLRPLVPWWIEGIRPEVRDRTVKSLVTRIRRDGTSDAGRYRLLGLLDWVCAHPDHPHAGAGLDLGLEGKDGAVRKPAAALAAAMGKTAVPEALARTDPDKGVRKRAQKPIEDVAVDKLF